LGLTDSLSSARTSKGYALLSGNNFPKDFVVPGGTDDPHATFWSSLRNLDAQVIALGQDDLLRAILPARYLDDAPAPDPFSKKLAFFRDGVSTYHFLASNAFIRTHRVGTNSIHSRGYDLMIDPDQTVAWTTKQLTVQLPVHVPPQGKYHVKVAGKDVDDKELKLKNQTLAFPVTLNPDADCAIEITVTWEDAPGEMLAFKLKVDRALTPWKNSGESDVLRDAPIAVLSGSGPQLIVVSLIDPGIVSLLEAGRWSRQADGVTETLVLLPADDTAQAILRRTANSQVVPVLLSDLSDTVNLKVLRLSSRWRIISVNPDSAVLGCNSGSTGCARDRTRPYSFGNYAILDAHSSRAQVWVRPEWLGETLIRISGTISGDQTWDHPVASLNVVRGFVRARGEPNITATETMQIFASATGELRRIMVPPQQRAAPPQQRAAPLQQRAAPHWWDTSKNVAVVLMEAMRQQTHSEVALSDLKMIDDDVVEELHNEAGYGLISDVSYPQLMDIFWRHDAYARTFIKGSDLADLIGKIAQLPIIDDDGGYCLRGLRTGDDEIGCDVPQKVDPLALRVNGRFLDPSLIYSLAVPQGLGQKLGLGDHKTVRTEMITGIYRFISSGGLDRIGASLATVRIGSAKPPVTTPRTVRAPQSFVPDVGGAGPDPPAPPTWKNPYENHWLGMIYVPPASIEVGGQNYKVPSQSNGTPDISGFTTIPNVGEKVTHKFKFNMVGEFHVVPIDLPWASLDLVSKANLNRLDTYPATSTGVKQIAYTPDLWTNGVAMRSRWISDRFNRFLSEVRAPAIRVEPFVGYFDDSSIFHFDNLYQSSAKDSKTNLPLHTLGEQDRKPNYLYLGAGTALGDIKLRKYLTLKKTAYEHDSGMNYTAPKDLRIGTSIYTMDQVRRCGVQKLIDGGSGCPAALINDDLTIRYLYAQQRQARQQLATSIEFAYGEGAAKRTFTVDLKANRWGAGANGYTPLDPLWTSEINLKAGVPVGAGIIVGPYFRYYFVKAFAHPAASSRVGTVSP
jgi:hypothetical protein